MADYTQIRYMFNSGSDASPVWNALAFGGTNQWRWCASGAGGASTPSASWPQFSQPASPAVVPEMWGFASDTSGIKSVYDGTNGKSNVLCVDFDNVGTMAAAPTWSAWSDSTHTTPVPGTQPGGQSGSPIINGSSDTGNSAYLKGNMNATVGTSLSAGACGTMPTATTGVGGSVSPSSGWMSTWQSLQGASSYIIAASTPAATTAGKIFLNFLLFTGLNMALGTMQFVHTFTYSHT